MKKERLGRPKTLCTWVGLVYEGMLPTVNRHVVGLLGIRRFLRQIFQFVIIEMSVFSSSSMYTVVF